MKSIYIIDTKLIFYNLKHRHQNLWDIFDEITHILHTQSKGLIYFASDLGDSLYRVNEQSYYKGNRRKKQSPQEIKEHEVFLKAYSNFLDLSKFLNVRVLQVPGLEADDQASILVKLLSADYLITLVTEDRDWDQIVLDNPHTRILLPKSGDFIYKKDLGVKTAREFCVLKAISGDLGDNIVLIKGVGKGRGKDLFNSILEKYVEPTNEQIIDELEAYLIENPKRYLHSLHAADGRKTIGEAFLSNLKVAETFLDCELMSKKQQKVFMKTKDEVHEFDMEGLFDTSFGLLGAPITLGLAAERRFV